MEKYPPVANNTPSNPKPNRLHALAFLEIGLIEFGFVIIVLLLLFGILNYFNILSVSSVFPNQLGWLPRQQIKLASQGETLQTPSQTNSSPSTFSYDTAKAKKLLTDYIKDTIKPQFIPSKIEVKQSLSFDGKITNTKYEFGSKFTSPTASFFVGFGYIEDSNNPNEFAIFIQPNNISKTDLTPALTNSLNLFYFNNPYPITSCKVKGTISICELYKIEINEKNGFGMFLVNSNTNFAPILFTCSISRENKDFDVKQSCTPFL